MKRKLWVRIFILFALGIILPLCLLVAIINGLIFNHMHELEAQKFQNDLKITSSAVDNILDSAQFSLGPLWADTSLQQNLSRLKPLKERNDTADFRRSRAILDALYDSVVRNIFIFSLDIYSVQGDTMFSTSAFSNHNIVNDFDLENSAWYLGYLRSSSGGNTWSSLCYAYPDEPQLIRYFPKRSHAGLRLEQIYSVSVSRSTVVSCINMENFTPNSSFFILDSSGSLFLQMGQLGWDALNAAQKDEIGPFHIPVLRADGTEYYAYSYSSPHSGLQYLFLVPTSAATNHNALSAFYIISVLIILLIVILFSIYIALHYGVHPMTRLFDAMQQVEKGNLNVRLPEDRDDEVGDISLHFNQMVSRLNTLVRNNVEMKAHEKDLELKFILSQLNEHFLYNTLDSIHWSAMKQHNQEICKVVSKLSKFYRNTLSNGKDVISVAEVEEIIESYLYVQKFRMQERLTYHLEIDPELLSCQVLKYLFQPIVENAVLHGVSCRAQGGHVEIRFSRSGNLMCFSVSDTGYGISKENLAEIRQRIQSTDPSDTCFALRNVNTQLDHVYGPDYHLNIESTEGVGTRVWFFLPLS